MEAATTQRWSTTTVTLLGSLVLLLLISEAYALQCHSSTSVLPYSSKGKSSNGFTTPVHTLTCPENQNECVEMQLSFSTGNMALLVTYKGCASKDQTNQAKGATVTDNHFDIQSVVVYNCSENLCNNKLTGSEIPKTTEQDKASEASGTLQCYSGVTLDAYQALETVTCSKSYNQCFQGTGTIRAGKHPVAIFIKSCQMTPCTIPQSQSFGPIEFSQQGSCCHDNYCNGKKASTTYSNGSFSEEATNFTGPDVGDGIKRTPAVASATISTPGRSWSTKASQNNRGVIDLDDSQYYDDASDDFVNAGTSNPALGPRGAKPGSSGQGTRLHFCPILIALGIVIFGLW